MLEIAAGQQIRTFFGTIDIAGTGVIADAVEIERHTATCGEGHFASGDEQATVGTVVVGKQQAITIEFLHGIEQAFQLGRIIHIRRIAAGGVVNLRQTGAAEAIHAEVKQQQFGFALINGQLRRFRLAHVVDRSKRGHDQRQRRHDLLLDAAIFPGGAHRQRILADRDRDADRLAQVGNGFDGIKQAGILTGDAARRHPVGRQLDLDEFANIGRRQVGQRFADGHAA